MKIGNTQHIGALLERIGRLLTTESQAEGLLPVQWETLRYLARANRFSQNAAALTAYLGLTKGTVSQTLGTLESKGLLRKRIDKQDRRSKHLMLTSKGRALLERDPIKESISTLDDLDASSRRQLATTLENYLTARLIAQDRKPFGQCRDCRYFARRHPDGSPHFCQLLEEKLAESDATSICFEQQPVTSDA